MLIALYSMGIYTWVLCSQWLRTRRIPFLSEMEVLKGEHCVNITAAAMQAVNCFVLLAIFRSWEEVQQKAQRRLCKLDTLQRKCPLDAFGLVQAERE